MNASESVQAGTTDRALVLVQGAHDRELLVDRLAGHCEVVTARPDEAWGTFDLCIVDTATYGRVADELATRKAATEPVFLPVLLLVSEREHDADHVAAWLDGPVDDVLVVPTAERVLTARVASLLHSRQLSLELDEERRRFVALAESASDGIVIMEADSTVRYANSATERIFGYPPETIEGVSLTELMPERYRDAHRAALERYLRTGERTLDWQGVEFTGLHADGHEVPIEVSFAEFKQTDERLFAGIIRDVTERVEREQSLEETRRRFELSLRGSDLAVWEVDVETDKVTIHTPETSHLDLGTTYPLETFTEHVHPSDREMLTDALEDALDGDTEFDVELRVAAPDDDGYLWLELAGDVHHEDDVPVRILGTARDITERKERERKLAASERRFRAVFEEANDAIVLADDDGEYVAANPAAGDLFGVEPDELLGRSIADFAPADYDFEGNWAAFQRGEQVKGEFPLVRPDGTVRTTLFSATPNVLPGRHLSVIRDVTERKEREEELERHALVVQTASDPIYTVDADGRFTLVNDALVKLTDAARDQLLGSPVASAFGESHADALAEQVESLLEAGEREGDVATSVEFDGTRHEFQTRVVLQPFEDEFRGFACVSHDVTTLVERERRLSVLDRVLRHNLRNKLNVALGHAMQLREVENEQVRDSAEAVVKAVEELLELSENARTFQSSIRPGDDDVLETVDVTESVQHTIEETRVTYPVVSIASTLPDSAWAHVHESFGLAVSELIENAVVHNPSDHPSVAVTVADRPDEHVVELQIADNGPGLPAMERTVFHEGAETPLEHMTGLGLWLVRWTVVSSGGSISVEENDPRGTVVVIRLPRAAAASHE